MPLYSYRAKSFKGETKLGVLEAKDEHQLARLLRQEGYILIEATLEEEVREKKGRIEFFFPFFDRVKLKEKIFFIRNLQVMIGAGVALPRGLEILARQAKSRKFRKTLLDIEQRIIKGESFSDSLSKHPGVFSELFVNMVKVGEEAGTLENVLKILAQQMEKENELKSKIKGAMIYPLVIILTMIGIGILMLIMVVPKLAETFKELNIELPFTTKIVIALGKFLAQKWYLVILTILALFFGLKIILKTKRGKQVVDFLFLKIPIISPIVRKTNSAYTVRTLSSLVAAGVPIVQSLEIVSRVLGNCYFREAIAKAAERVRKGSKLSESLRPYEELYPSVVIQMIEVGEETGETSTILEKLAYFFEEEVAIIIKNLSSLIEPVLMLIIGAVVGFFVVSMVQPMYSMLGAIK